MSYFCRSRNTILCSRLPYAVAHSLFFASHPRCSLVPEAVSHRGGIYTVVLGRVPRNRKHLEARGSSRDPSPKGHRFLTNLNLTHYQTSLKRMFWNCGTGLIREDEIKTVMPFPRAKTRNLSNAFFLNPLTNWVARNIIAAVE